MKSTINVFCFFLLCLVKKEILGDEFESVERPRGTEGNPGARLFLSTSGLDYLKGYAAQIFDEEIAKIQLSQLQYTYGTGDVTLENAVITNYDRVTPTLTLSPPNVIKFHLGTSNIRISGDFRGENRRTRRITGQGTFEGIISSVDLMLQMVVSVNSDGFPHLSLSSCDMQKGSIQGSILTKSTSRGQAIAKAVKPSVETTVPLALETALCRLANELVETANRKLLTMKLVTRLDTTVSDGSLYQIRHGESANDETLIVDHRIMEPLTMTSSDIEATLKGEISWNDRGGTPFYPEETVTSGASRRMARFQTTEHGLNSLLYHAYQKQLYEFWLTRGTNPRFHGLLQTNCAQDKTVGICIGDLLVGLVDQFPAHSVALHFIPDRAPFVIFEPTTATLRHRGLLRIYVIDPANRQQPIFVAESTMRFQAAVNFTVSESGNVIGNLSHAQQKLTLVRSDTPAVTQADLDLLADVTADRIGAAALVLIQNGVPLPIPDGMTLVNTRITLRQHTVQIDSDFEMRRDENVAGK